MQGEMGIPQDSKAGRQEFAERMERRRRKGDAGKVKLARRLRGETTMTLAWIARRLKMGAWTYVANLINPTNPNKIKS